MTYAALWIWLCLAAIPIYLAVVVVADWRAARNERLGDPTDPRFEAWLEEHKCR
jgi:hypothetical protein